MGTYSFEPAALEALDRKVNVPFDKVTPDGGIYCYERFIAGRTAGGLPTGRMDGVLLLSLAADSTLMVEKQGDTASACESIRPWQFTGSATRYER
jgi:hypothetical protein